MRDRHVFKWHSLEILNVFNSLTLQQNFPKIKTFLKILEYRFSIESTNIKRTSFPYKTILSNANFKTNRIGRTYHKEESFGRDYFVFLKILFQFKKLVQRLDLVYQPRKCPYSKALEFYLGLFFPCEYPEWALFYSVITQCAMFVFVKQIEGFSYGQLILVQGQHKDFWRQLLTTQRFIGLTWKIEQLCLGSVCRMSSVPPFLLWWLLIVGCK